jgi:cobalt-zinc-cadmium efflux system outer membrane protein
MNAVTATTRYKTDLPSVAAILLFLSVRLLASPGAAIGATLTLDAAVSLAAEHNPHLLAALAQVEAAEAGITTAEAYPNPEVAMLAGRQTIAYPGNISGMVHSYSFTQALELGPLRPARREFALRGRESSERALAEIRLAVLSAVRRSFFEALRKQAEIEILSDNLRLVEELRKRIQVRVEVGEAGRLELIRADAEVTTSRTAVNTHGYNTSPPWRNCARRSAPPWIRA